MAKADGVQADIAGKTAVNPAGTNREAGSQDKPQGDSTNIAEADLDAKIADAIAKVKAESDANVRKLQSIKDAEVAAAQNYARGLAEQLAGYEQQGQRSMQDRLRQAEASKDDTEIERAKREIAEYNWRQNYDAAQFASWEAKKLREGVAAGLDLAEIEAIRNAQELAAKVAAKKQEKDSAVLLQAERKKWEDDFMKKLETEGLLAKKQDKLKTPIDAGAAPAQEEGVVDATGIDEARARYSRGEITVKEYTKLVGQYAKGLK